MQVRLPSVALLERLGVKRYKIASGESVNRLLLRAVAATGKPLIVSTGIFLHEKIAWTLGFLQSHGAGPVTLLHCLSQYPVSDERVNLRDVEEIREKHGVPVGYSDHATGP